MSKRVNHDEDDENDDEDEVEIKRSKSGNKGKWTAEEDELLRDGLNELGNEWTEIAKRIKGRTGRDCNHRWNNCIRPDIIKGHWSTEVTVEFKYNHHAIAK